MPSRSKRHASWRAKRASSAASPPAPRSPPLPRWHAKPVPARWCWRCCPTPVSVICPQGYSRGSSMAQTRNPEVARSNRASASSRNRQDREPMSEPLTVALPDPFLLYRGGVLHQARIAYECWGKLNAARDNAVLLFTGLSPSAHAAATDSDPAPGWWQRIVSPGLAPDRSRYFIVCVNSLGSCFGSTGAASINPATGERYRLDFPEIAVEDIARAGYEAMRALGVEQLDTVIGASLGGMSVVAFATQFPHAARRLISISGSPAASPFAIALRSVQREAILRDPDWQAGQYAPDQPPRSGMRVARKLGTITYRS